MVSNDEEAQVSFLLSGVCDVVPSSYIKLRSYLNIHLSNVAEQQNLNLPKGFRNRNKSCPHCYSEWTTDSSSFKLLPTKKSKFLKAQNKNKEDEVKESRNTLALKCKVCMNKSLFSLVKKKHVEKIVKEETVKSDKKKKKKKDKTCGLKVDKSVLEVSKMEKRSEHIKTQPQGNQKLPKNVPNLVCDKNKKLNPFALQSQGGKFSKKNYKKVKDLKIALKAQKRTNLAKKTFKDFLNVI